MPQGSLHIADDEFFSAPFKTRDSLETPLMMAEKDAVVADLPRKVPVDVRATLPLVFLRVAHTAVAVGVPLDKFGIVVAADAVTGQVRVGRAVTPPVKRVEESAPLADDGMSGEACLIDVRQQVDLPWRPAELSVSLILREQITEPLRVSLGYSPGAYRDEAVEAQKQKDLLAAPLPLIHPAGGTYGKDPAPEAVGLSLSAERVVKLHADGPLTVKGSFRVKIPKHLFVDAKRGEALQLDPKPAALVPITLVITASKAPVPFVYDLVVPSWEADPKTGIAAGSFAVDLDKVGTVRTVPRTLFIYAFAGDQRFGPLPIGMQGEEE
ncbi:MAG TPA: hypothetical protein VH083_09075 [Myxococcales bacterium]|jgi:hypothetical protein|nr:hypothetical protein [Myxococcales bacterium]